MRRRLAAACAAAWMVATPCRAADHLDLRYGPAPLQSLDLHVPEGGGPAPVVVYFHGGAFVGGDKHPCAPQLAAGLAARHVAFACADYRLAPAVRYPVPMRDGARAVQWLRAHAGDYGLDPARVGLMGLSAGAGVALWVAFRPDLADPASPDPVLRQSTAVAAVVTGNPHATYDPADIEARLHTRRLPEILPPDSAPPDYIHSPAQGEILAEVGRERGASVVLRTSADTGGWRGFLGEAVAFFASNLDR